MNEKCISFEVDFEEKVAPQKIPKRFLKHMQERPCTADLLLLKQQQANTRRMDIQKDKIQRIKEKQEECKRINNNITRLLEQDAKRRGLPGTELIRPMSSREASTTIRSVVHTFNKLTTGISQDIDAANSLSEKDTST